MKKYQYYGSSGWIKQPNRIVKTFPSGLCMIQQDYVRRKDKVDYFSFKLGDKLMDIDSAPCIDGAYIFPEPDYQDSGNGFIKCTVVAYGRVNKTGSKSATLRNSLVFTRIIKQSAPFSNSIVDVNGVERNKILSSEDIAVGLLENGFLEVLTQKFVIAQGESLINDANFEFKIFNSQGNQVKYPITEDLGSGFKFAFVYDPSIYAAVDPTQEMRESYSLSGEARITPILQRYDSVDYGQFTEITATYYPKIDIISKKSNIVFYG